MDDGNDGNSGYADVDNRQGKNKIMIAKEELKLEDITANYYAYNLCKQDSNITLSFGEVNLLFIGSLIFKCGYPNEEIFMYYDYYTQGSMRKYCLYEMQQSEWISTLIKVNKVHSRHTDEVFKDDRHFIILFDDEVFECIATSYQVIGAGNREI